MTPFTATTHEAATIARAGMGGTVAIVRRLKRQHDRLVGMTEDGQGIFKNGNDTPFADPLPLSPGKPVWVKEGFTGPYAYEVNGYPPSGWGNKPIWFPADGPVPEKHANQWWHKSRPAIQLPRWASRFTLTPETVRVCRVQDVTEAEALKAGVEWLPDYWVREDAHIGGTNGDFIPNQPPQAAFRDHWNAQHGPAAWERNDWVMVALCKIGGPDVE